MLKASSEENKSDIELPDTFTSGVGVFTCPECGKSSDYLKVELDCTLIQCYDITAKQCIDNDLTPIVNEERFHCYSCGYELTELEIDKL